MAGFGCLCTPPRIKIRVVDHATSGCDGVGAFPYDDLIWLVDHGSDNCDRAIPLRRDFLLKKPRTFWKLTRHPLWLFAESWNICVMTPALHSF
jgi:hypothetical protein